MKSVDASTLRGIPVSADSSADDDAAAAAGTGVPVCVGIALTSNYLHLMTPINKRRTGSGRKNEKKGRKRNCMATTMLRLRRQNAARGAS